ncbi:Multidomain esterase [Pseudocercospora fuligena]|uniref:Multidomain esterase n=1 Tax=Pseudocercospora fuligena TaxID=685502 RepID=A0A8H6VP89_9PEZI|nr:Multidomain esterase [Pseudocercospora fuligena]
MSLGLALVLLSVIGSASSASPQQRGVNAGMELRIMPQGASVTRGTGSMDETGYRQILRSLLEQDGNHVTFVGSVSWGDMDGNLCEGHPGYTIQGIDDIALSDGAYEYLPNVILLNAGTNDCNLLDQDPGGAPARYTTLLNHIREHNPDTTVVASSLLPNLKESVDDCVRTLNAGIKEAVDNASAAGMKMGWVDVYNAVPKKDIHPDDNTHPTDEGYELLASAWYSGIQLVADKITAPDPNGKAVPDTTACGGLSDTSCED